MAQRVRNAHRGQSPSSARQLPILAALHARIPTLFLHIIHHRKRKVNPFFWLKSNLRKLCFGTDGGQGGGGLLEGVLGGENDLTVLL